MEWWHVYLFTRLESINIALTIAYVAMCVMVGILLIVFLVSEGDIPSKAHRKMYWKRFVGGILAFTVLCIMVPSQKEAAAIYLLPKLARSDFAKEAQQLPADATKLLRLKLESWIADMEPKKAASAK